MSDYDEKDAAKDTRSSERKVTESWHGARDDSGVRTSDPDDRPTEQNQKDAAAKTAEIIDRGKR